MTSTADAASAPAGEGLLDPGAGEEYPLALAARLGSRFQVPAPLEAFDFPEKGNINRDTFLIAGGAPARAKEYLLQRINQQVFTRPKSVMAAMVASLEAQRQALSERPLPEGRQWEAITLIPTRAGAPYLECRSRRGETCWRLMAKIQGCRTFKSLSEVADRRRQLELAEEAGRGLAMYGDLTAGMDIKGLVSPLPGYRDTRVYYDQFASILNGNRTIEEARPHLPKDEIVRESTKQHFVVQLSAENYRRRKEDPRLERLIRLAREEEEFGMRLLRAMASGRIRTVAIHGDTKLENFLFSARTGQAISLVDLDTIMPHTWLADWGDMVRSLSNVAGEKEADLSRVQVDMEIYEAVARGFLSTARAVTPAEVALMVEAVEIIALELGVRFLTDYLRGDSYFTLSPADPPDLNRTRALVQLTLFENLRQNAGTARRRIEVLLPSAMK
ncbi:MAG: phosphotransferase [Planctomycetes bacterium]|nr:phosphotransferase [Planctomycetota bacterium]